MGCKTWVLLWFFCGFLRVRGLEMYEFTDFFDTSSFIFTWGHRVDHENYEASIVVGTIPMCWQDAGVPSPPISYSTVSWEGV